MLFQTYDFFPALLFLVFGWQDIGLIFHYIAENSVAIRVDFPQVVHDRHVVLSRYLID